jgi:hypothetical protein
MLKKSDNYCYQQRIKSNRKVERVIIKLGAIEKSRILLLQHGKNYQFDSEPKIILHFWDTNDIYAHFRWFKKIFADFISILKYGNFLFSEMIKALFLMFKCRQIFRNSNN